MQPRADNVELLLARWVLGEVAPEDVPALATVAVAHGCNAPTVAVLAGLSRPTRADVEDELPALLHELHVHLPSVPEALKMHVDLIAHQVVDGTVAPSVGAYQLRSAGWIHTDQLWSDQLLVFTALATEYYEENRPTQVLDRATLAASSAFLAGGGLQVAH